MSAVRRPRATQTSIASFFASPKRSKREDDIKPSIGLVREIIDLTSRRDGQTFGELKPELSGLIDISGEIQAKETPPPSPTKKRKLSHSPTPPLLKHDPESSSSDSRFDLTVPFTYPASNATGTAYQTPPDPSFNHPIRIDGPSLALLSELRFNTIPRPILQPKLDLDLLYFKSFIHSSSSHALMNHLLEVMPWYRVKYTVRGININTPRWTTVFGKDSEGKGWRDYKPGVKPRAIPEIMLRLMQKVEEVTGSNFNFTLINYYADGNDSISYHSDSESFLGPNPTIASLSLGSARDFHLRHVKYKTNTPPTPVEKFVLQSGDMVVMRGGTQANWQHTVPKRKGDIGGRINITFRRGVVRYATKNYLDYNVGSGPMYRWNGREMVEQN